MKKINWKTFLENAQNAFGENEYDLAIAYGAAALQMPSDAIADQLPVYELMYQCFTAKEDVKKAKEYLQACMGLEPSRKDFIVEWFTKFEKLKIAQVTNREIEAIENDEKPDWYVVSLEKIQDERILYAIKVMMDNNTYYGDLGEGNYIVSRAFCEKLKINPWELLIDHFAHAYQHYIRIH